jgi:hypothetical protein
MDISPSLNFHSVLCVLCVSAFASAFLDSATSAISLRSILRFKKKGAADSFGWVGGGVGFCVGDAGVQPRADLDGE